MSELTYSVNPNGRGGVRNKLTLLTLMDRGERSK